MRAGDLRNRIGFYCREIISDGAGNTQADFETVPRFVVAANVRPKLGGEQILAGRLTGRNLVNVTVRQSAQTLSVTDDWKAKDENSGEQLAIHSIIDPFEATAERGRWLEMLCEKGVAA